MPLAGPFVFFLSWRAALARSARRSLALQILNVRSYNISASETLYVWNIAMSKRAQYNDGGAVELVTALEALARHVALRNQGGRDDEPVLTPQGFRVVEAIGEQASCTMGELADCTLRAVSSLTGLVDRLVERRLVARERSEADRRVVRVRLTAAGRKLCTQRQRRLSHAARAMLEALAAPEQEQLLALMRKIGKSISPAGKPMSAKERRP